MDTTGHDAAIDFTYPRAVAVNVARALEQGVPCIVGTTGADVGALHDLAVGKRLPLFCARTPPIGAVLMMRFAAEASREGAAARGDRRAPPRSRKLDAPSGTAGETKRAGWGGTCRSSVSPAGPARAPGGDLRRRRPDADDPARHHVPRGLRARGFCSRWSAASASARRHHGRTRQAPVVDSRRARRSPRCRGDAVRLRGAIDVRKFIELCTFLVDSSSDGIVVAGTTGESPTLTDEERLTLFAAAVGLTIGDRAAVIAGNRHVLDRAHSCT